MPARLKASLAHPVLLSSAPPRSLETLLDAVAYVHERQQATPTDRGDQVIDLLLLAAATQDPVDIKHATAQLSLLLNHH